MSYPNPNHPNPNHTNPSPKNLNYSNNPNNLFNQSSHQNQPIHQDFNVKYILNFLGFSAVALLGAFVSMRYKISKSNQYIVRTGLGIKDLQIIKKCVQWPFQKVYHIDLSPKSYSFTLHAMSNEKMEFMLPCVFTIGPKDNIEYLTKYSKYLIFETEEKVNEIIKGMIEGETRILAANMSIEDIFKGRTEFKDKIVHTVETELQKMGLTIYNANIKELQDSKDSKYFSFLSMKISVDAENQAKVDIAEARKRGQIGEKERDGDTRQRVSTVEAQTKIFENQREQEVAESQAQLQKKKAEYDQIVKIAQIESIKNAQKREEEMQKEVELQRQNRELEKARAETLTQAKVKAEIQIVTAQGESNSIVQLADAMLYKKTKEAEAQLIVKTKEAEGVQALFLAQATGLHKLTQSFNNDQRAVLTYMMLEKDLFPKLAEESAKAIQGLNPKITVWNTGNEGKTFDSIAGLAKAIPPIVETIQDQTKVQFPDWLIKTKPEELLKQSLTPKDDNKK